MFKFFYVRHIVNITKAVTRALFKNDLNCWKGEARKHVTLDSTKANYSK